MIALDCYLEFGDKVTEVFAWLRNRTLHEQ